MKLFLIIAALAGATTSAPASPGDTFFANLTALCGKRFEGRLVSNDPQDQAMGKKRLVMHVRECTDREIRIPFHVGEDQSRTWIIIRDENRLILKHDHRHEDGSEDKLSHYGGSNIEAGTSMRQEFPADEYSKTLFRAEGIAASADNVWVLELTPGKTYAYELRRPRRFFRVEFDLNRPLGVTE